MMTAFLLEGHARSLPPPQQAAGGLVVLVCPIGGFCSVLVVCCVFFARLWAHTADTTTPPSTSRESPHVLARQRLVRLNCAVCVALVCVRACTLCAVWVVVDQAEWWCVCCCSVARRVLRRVGGVLRGWGPGRDCPALVALSGGTATRSAYSYTHSCMARLRCSSSRTA